MSSIEHFQFEMRIGMAVAGIGATGARQRPFCGLVRFADNFS